MIEFKVFGVPGPQGSKSFKGMVTSKKTGRAIPRLLESSAKVKPWRAAVKSAAIEEAKGRRLLSLGRDGMKIEPFQVTGAVVAEMTFTMPRPKSAKRGALPSKRPDLSKLIRSTEDAITDAGTWEDDARVISITAHKRYPNEGADALPEPGAVIRIRRAA